jgi:hypothetical protein
VYEVVTDDPSNPFGGAAGDGSFVARFKNAKEAEYWASAHTHNGRACQVSSCDVSRKLAARWSYFG